MNAPTTYHPCNRLAMTSSAKNPYILDFRRDFLQAGMTPNIRANAVDRGGPFDCAIGCIDAPDMLPRGGAAVFRDGADSIEVTHVWRG